MAKQVVVIGAGYAGILATVRLAGKTRDQNVNITLINASDNFVERVRLHQLAAGTEIKKRPLVEILRGTNVSFQQGTVTNIDLDRRKVVVQTSAGVQPFNYDYLLYALGSTTARDVVPGVDQYAYTLTPAGPFSAPALSDNLPAINAAGGQLIVCGGGATGIEAAAEFAKAFPNLRVRLVTQGDLGTFLGKSVADYMRRSLTNLGVIIQDHTTITEITENQVITSTGAALPYDLCLWTGGFGVSALARESGLTVNERGQILIDPYMRSVSHPEVYALGDSAMPVEVPGVHVRMSAFTAIVMGAHGADCLNAVLRGKSPKPLSFAYAGQGIALGHHNAIGFNNYPNDKPNLPYFTGRVGYETREFFVRTLAALPYLERRWPGLFYWLGKGRYAAMKRTKQYIHAKQEHAAQ